MGTWHNTIISLHKGYVLLLHLNCAIRIKQDQNNMVTLSGKIDRQTAIQKHQHHLISIRLFIRPSVGLPAWWQSVWDHDDIASYIQLVYFRNFFGLWIRVFLSDCHFLNWMWSMKPFPSPPFPPPSKSKKYNNHDVFL